MPRPFCCRHVGYKPGTVYFKPAGVPLVHLKEVVLSLDELESLRLADFNGLYQVQAAKRMKVSRATFARIVETARRTVADALLHGKALRIEGGTVELKPKAVTNANERQGRRGLCRRGKQKRHGLTDEHKPQNSEKELNDENLHPR